MLSDFAVDTMEREAAHQWAVIVARRGLDTLCRMTDAERMATIKSDLGFDDAETLKIDFALMELIHKDAPPATPRRRNMMSIGF